MKLGHVSRKKINGEEALCFSVQKEGYDKRNRCVDAMTHLPVEAGSPSQKYEFSDYQAIGSQRYPGKIRMAKDGKWVFEVRDIRVEAQAPDADIFSAPPGAEEFETCDDLRDTRAINDLDPLGSTAIQVNQSVAIYLYGIVEKDGSFRPEEAVTVPPDPKLAEFVKAIAAKRRYAPAMCGSKPVATEIQIEVQMDLR